MKAEETQKKENLALEAAYAAIVAIQAQAVNAITETQERDIRISLPLEEGMKIVGHSRQYTVDVEKKKISLTLYRGAVAIVAASVLSLTEEEYRLLREKVATSGKWYGLNTFAKSACDQNALRVLV